MANKKISELPYINVTKISGNTLVPLVTYFSAATGDTVHTYANDLKSFITSGISGNFLPLSGGTVSGGTRFLSGLTANTVSATTYFNLPTDIRVTGGTYSAGTISFTNNTGGTFNVTGLTTGSTSTVSGNYLPLSGGTVTGGTIFNQGLTATTISATTYYNVSSNFQYEIHVSQVDGNDTTGDGSLLNPVATITKALTLLTGSRKTIIVHPSTYTENVTVANTNTTISTTELTGANTLLSGTLTIGSLGSGTRISGLKMTNLVISGTAQAYISNCTVDTQVTKSSSGYVEIINSELQCISGIQISGSGTTIINGNKNVGISVSNVSAQVIVKGCNSVVTPSASAGNLAIVDCIVTALGGNAITITNSATTLTLINSQVLVQAGNNVAPISVAGIYSIINTIYDKPGSTFTGTSTNSIDYFQFINADKFITQGGTSSQYVMGDGSLSNGFTGGTVSGGTRFLSGLTANTVSATTYFNLPTDVRVTGATYSAGTISFTNNTGGTFNVTGLTTGSTSTVSGDYLPLSGGTVTGNTSFTSGLTSNTISATTYQNLPVSGLTSGSNINVSGSSGNFTISVTGLTQGLSGDYLPLSGGTVTGNTIFTQGITATTISATTYQNLPTDIRVTGVTNSNNTFTFTNNTGGTFSTIFNTVTGLTINGNLTVTGNTNMRGFTGTTGYISGSGQNILTVIGSGNSTTSPLFTVQGSSGELFSVNDSLVGSLFSVNDISGLPILEVFSDNTTLMGSYQAPSLNTTTRVTLTAGTNTVYSIPTSAYTGAFIDYTLVSTGTTGARAGNIMTIWSGSTAQYTETSTNDIGTTTGVTFSVAVSGSNAVLSSSATTTGWTLKTIVRSI